MSRTSLRLPAEWEPSEAVLLAWPQSDSDWDYILDEVRATYIEIISAISDHAKVIIIGQELPDIESMPESCRRDNIILADISINDTWTRDYGPITCYDGDGDPVFNDFCFNGWGLKFAADRDNLATSALYESQLEGWLHRYPSFVLEGGSIDTDGNGTLLTTESCLLSVNRNEAYTRDDIEGILSQAIGARKVLWLKNGHLAGDDTDGHIDTLARIVPPGDIILYTGCSDPDDEHYESLQAMKEELSKFTTLAGTPFHLLELPLPDPVYDPDDGHRLPATYANFLIVNGAVILPVYGQPMKDMMAVKIIQAAMPEYEIVTVDCSVLIRQHGSLHCATMQLPLNSLKQDE